MGLISLSFLLRDNDMFSFFNCLLLFFLFGIMAVDIQGELNIAEGGFGFIGRAVSRVFEPLGVFDKPFLMFKDIVGDKSKGYQTAVKVLLGLVICVPILTVVSLLMAFADVVFADMLSEMLEDIDLDFFAERIIELAVAIFVALYFFGQLYYLLFGVEEKKRGIIREVKPKEEPQDLIIFYMIYSALVVVYTVFAYVQVKYLFLGMGELPHDALSYAEYARQGFFELLLLTFINVAVLLITIKLAQKRIYERRIKGSKFLRLMMEYLCLLTMLLLSSSFYKMLMYHDAYGLTRMRLLVIIFLLFEAVGLIATMIYIFNRKIRIVATYSFICLAFYITVNLINIDAIVATNNINIYKETGKIDIYYLSTLSVDAHKQLSTLAEIGDDKEIDYAVSYERYQSVNKLGDYAEKSGWQSFSIPRYLANSHK